MLGKQRAHLHPVRNGETEEMACTLSHRTKEAFTKPLSISSVVSESAPDAVQVLGTGHLRSSIPTCSAIQ